MAFFVPADVRNGVGVSDKSGADWNRFTIVGEKNDWSRDVFFVTGLFVAVDDVFGLELILGGGINQMNLIGGVVATVREEEAGGVGMPMNAGVIA